MRLTSLCFTKTIILGLFLVAGLVLVTSSAIYAQSPAPTPAPTPVPLKVTKVWVYTGADDKLEAGMGDKVGVEVEHLSEAITQDKINPRDLILYLNGFALNGVNAETIGPSEWNQLLFKLKRTDGSREAWSTLLGKPGFDYTRKGIPVSVGFPDKQAFLSNPENTKINLRVYHPYWAAGTLVGLILTIALFIWLARKSNIIRDSGPPQPPPGSQRPYSLARCQAAFWFFMVIGSFLLIYLITGDYNSITPQALILISIGTGTALSAAMIDASKTETADDALNVLRPDKSKLAAEIGELQTKITGLDAKVKAGTATEEEKRDFSLSVVDLAAKQALLQGMLRKIDDASAGLSKPVSETFRKDLLTDEDGQISFHRFQIVIWTIVLGFLFCVGVYKALAMPEFDATLLALMGISSATYLGFKIPERQS